MSLDDNIVLCISICSECNQRCLTSQFLSSTGPLLSPICQLCRREEAISHSMDVLYYIIDDDDLQARDKYPNIFLNKVVYMHYQNFDPSLISVCGHG